MPFLLSALALAVNVKFIRKLSGAAGRMQNGDDDTNMDGRVTTDEGGGDGALVKMQAILEGKIMGYAVFSNSFGSLLEGNYSDIELLYLRGTFFVKLMTVTAFVLLRNLFMTLCVTALALPQNLVGVMMLGVGLSTFVSQRFGLSKLSLAPLTVVRVGVASQLLGVMILIMVPLSLTTLVCFIPFFAFGANAHGAAFPAVISSAIVDAAQAKEKDSNVEEKSTVICDRTVLLALMSSLDAVGKFGAYAMLVAVPVAASWMMGDTEDLIDGVSVARTTVMMRVVAIMVTCMHGAILYGCGKCAQRKQQAWGLLEQGAQSADTKKAQ